MHARRPFARAARVAVALAALALVAGATPPETMQIDGHRLERIGAGTREKLFVDLYSIGLYLPGGQASSARALRRRDVAKAIRVEVLYDGSVPDEIPAGWRSELMPVLDAGQERSLRRHYQALGAGDTVVIAYTPDSGTEVLVGGERILHDEGHRLMDSFLDIWIGRDPVSEDLKSSLL